jgi:tetratricopeptide (TPR) repeat protein
MAASRRRLAAALWTLAVLLSASAPRAASDEERIREAIDTYTRGLNTEHRDPRIEEFRRAQRLFASVAIGTRNAALYTNLGNAALQAEDLGSSILAYRRALRVAPGHARALQNLDHARSLLPDWVPRPGPEGVLDSLFFWQRSVPLDLRALLAALCFAVAALLVAAAIRFRQSALRNAAILPLLGWGGLLASVLSDPSRVAQLEAVVTVPEVVARAADSSLAPSAFPQPLPGGVEVRILEQRPPWVRIRLANGRDAWLPGSSLASVGAESAPRNGPEGTR